MDCHADTFLFSDTQYFNALVTISTHGYLKKIENLLRLVQDVGMAKV